MANYPLIVANATLLFLAIFLILEYAIRRRQIRNDLAQNRKKQEQLAAYSAELKDLKKELTRNSEVAQKIPLITKKFTEKLPVEAYPPTAVRSLKEFFHADKVGYFAPVEGSTDFTLVVGAGFPPDWLGKVRISSGDGMLGMAFHKKEVIAKGDPDAMGRRTTRRSLEELGVTPDFVAPVFGASGISGALVVTGVPFPLDQEKASISMFADLLSTMLQNVALLDSSRNAVWMDPLTGVANRLHFLQRFESEIRRTKNYEQALALFMFDIDEFKKVNDTYGHHAGDVVIRKMAEVVKKNTRSTDLVARFGGDEFIVLITSTTKEQAATFAEKLREKIAGTDMPIAGVDVPLRITISGGMAVFPLHGQSTTDLFRVADEALYESKRNGRNRILVAPSVGLADWLESVPDGDRPPRDLESEPDKAESEGPDYALGELGGNLHG